MKSLTKFLHEEKGQGLAEYGLILALIAIVVIVALTSLGSSVNNSFQNTSDQFP